MAGWEIFQMRAQADYNCDSIAGCGNSAGSLAILTVIQRVDHGVGWC